MGTDTAEWLDGVIVAAGREIAAAANAADGDVDELLRVSDDYMRAAERLFAMAMGAAFSAGIAVGRRR